MHPLLHPNCHHQIVFSKLNLKIECPPLYERLVWDYKNAESKSIKKKKQSKCLTGKIYFKPEIITIK